MVTLLKRRRNTHATGRRQNGSSEGPMQRRTAFLITIVLALAPILPALAAAAA
jgi:hypothetical protein